MSHIVVIGAGIGGLTAAIDLSSAGHQVTVLERGALAGGKAGIAVVDGVEFDTGPSVLTLPGAFDSVFQRAGTSLAAELTLTLPEPASRYLYPDGAVVDVYSDRAATRTAVATSLGLDAAEQLDAFLDYAEGIWNAAAPHFIEGDAPTPGRLLKLVPAMIMDLPRIDPFRTMRAGIARHVREPRLRWLLERYATYNGSDPAKAPATLNCIAHVELGLGVYGVKGGIHELIRALVRVAVGAGAELRLNSAVDRVETASGRVVAVHSGAERLRVDAIVANADIRHLARDLLEPALGRRLEPRSSPSMSGWTAVLKARRRGDERVGHTVAFPERYDEEFRDIFDRDRAPVDPTIYVCAQERCHGRRGWRDHEPLFIMANAPAEPESGATPLETWSRLRELALQRLRRAELIDPDDVVVWERTPTGLATAFPGTLGALYGSASNDAFAAFRRPPNRLRAVPGLYLASGSAHPGGGMPLCSLSGQAAARAVINDLG